MLHDVRRTTFQNQDVGQSELLDCAGNVAKDEEQPTATALLLQGPIGPFFSRFGKDLEQRGFNVFKINFNGGDRLFCTLKGAFDYTGELSAWGAYLERFIANKSVNRIYLFGDCRAYHRVARDVAKRLNVRVFVFEEGYLRPNFITLEEGGVNGHSQMMGSHLELPEKAFHDSDSTKIRSAFVVCAIFSMIYYCASAWHGKRFSHYQHHRPFEWFSEGSVWVRSIFRKVKYRKRGERQLEDCLATYDGEYFVCPLQVHCDMQVLVHSPFNSIEHFIGEVLSSFAQHAPAQSAIVFKHHPLDRGYSDYTTLIGNLQAELGLHGRVFYVHDVALPPLLQHAAGSVMINSTVGLSSLFHNAPVKVMGNAIYDREGLTFQGPLDQFWNKPGKVDAELFARFRHYLIQNNQLNGNFYVRLNPSDTVGIRWSDQLVAEHCPAADRERTTADPVVNLRVVGGLDTSCRTKATISKNQSKAA